MAAAIVHLVGPHDPETIDGVDNVYVKDGALIVAGPFLHGEHPIIAAFAPDRWQWFRLVSDTPS